MISFPTKADVVVIGGGPAGSTAANLLAQRGHDVVLLDAAKHPRNTVGESMLPHAWKYFDQLGATQDIIDARFLHKSGGMSVWNGKLTQMRMKDFFKQPSMHIDRDRFDKVLLDVAARQGARVFEEVKVREVLFDGDRATGVAYLDKSSGEAGRIACRYVVDASGQAAVIANQLRFREFDPDLRFMCVWGYYEGSDHVSYGARVHPFEDRWEEGKEPDTFFSHLGDWGWCWHITQAEHTSVGLVMPPSVAATFKAIPGTLEERFAAFCARVPATSELLKPATLKAGSVSAIRDFAYYPKQLAGEGWFLAGDAAAFVDPINSAGVVVAFYGGFLAAWAVGASLEEPAREERYRALFAALLRQRLALFRTAAIPAGTNSHPEDYERALRAAQFEGTTQQELLYVQTQITNRPSNLEPLLAMDDRLRYHDPARFVRHTQITRPDGTPLPIIPLTLESRYAA